MENIVIVFFLVVGLILMIKSADYFVDSAVRIAELSGIPKLIVGATIVSLATTLPELFVSSTAIVLKGSSEMAVGNALGSVIFNTAVILSIAAIFMSGKVDRKNLLEKSIILVLGLIALIIFSLDLIIVWYEGVILLLIVVVYTILNIRAAKKQKESRIDIPIAEKSKRMTKNTIILVISAIGVAFGAHLLVDNAVAIAEKANISKQIIGLTILALGTSLPELVTTITAVIKKQQSLSIGNILGANILNITMIMGTSSLLSKGLEIQKERLLTFQGMRYIPQTLFIDLPVVFVVIMIFVIPIIIKGELRKWQGYTGLSIFILYMTYLLINASI